MKEIEARFLNIDIDAMRAKLKKLKAKRIHPLMLYRRYIFHLQNKEERGYARVRQEDKNITMTIKKYGANKYASEYEVELDESISLEDARNFMIGAGFVQKAYHETLREKWKVPSVNEIVIDVIPGLPPYIEIEATSEEKMLNMCSKLGLSIENAKYGAYGKQFDEYYGIPQSVADDQVAELRFETIVKHLKPFIKKNKALLTRIQKSNLQIAKSIKIKK